MKLQDICENAAGGSVGAGSIGAFVGRLFVGKRPIKRFIQDPNGDVPVIQYSKRSKKETSQ